MMPGPGAGAAVRDRLGRPLEDLRVSVTPECNFRCPYCMPVSHFPPGYGRSGAEARLGFPEIARIVAAAVPLGLRKVRFTGGEPLLRRGLWHLVRRVAEIPGLDDLALSTNGMLLEQQAARLADAGLARVNVSVDGISRGVFSRMTGGRGSLDKILRGIAAAREAGLRVKLNMVVRRGWNEDEVVPMAEFARRERLPLRFIEFMDVGMTNRWSRNEVVPAEEILAAASAIAPLHPLPAESDGETARRHAYADGSGEIGIIASVTRPFCRDCRRARLTSDGRLHTCLFSGQGHDLRAALAAGDQELTARLDGIWTAREDRYSELRAVAQAAAPRPEMSYLGG